MLKKYFKKLIREVLNEGIGVLKVGQHTSYLDNGQLHINAGTPKVRLEGTEVSAGDFSFRENAGKVEIYDEVSTSVVATIDITTGNVETLGNFTIDPTISKATPLVSLQGTETGGINASLKENAGALQIVDDTNAVTLLNLNANQPIVIDIPVPVVFETAQTGLAADAAGVVFTSQSIIPPLANYHSVAVEATWTASATDSVTAIELYDSTGAAVLASVSGNTGTDAKSVYATPTAGNSLAVRANVTTASATTGATTGVNKAVVYFRVTLS